MKKDITIVGAGLVGSLCAVYMTKRGHKVTIYERRKDLRSEIIAAGRDPGNVGAIFILDKLVELQPIGTNDASVVWE